MAKKITTKTKKLWYAISDQKEGNCELYPYENIEIALKEGGWDFDGKRYVFKVELLGELKQTVKIV